MPDTYNPDTPIAQLAAAVVAALGDGWTVDTEYAHNFGAIIANPDVQLFLHDVTNSTLGDFWGRGGPTSPLAPLGTVQASGLYPRTSARTRPYHLDVNATRDPRDIATDIREQLVPDVAVETARVRAVLDRQTSNRAARHPRRDELLRVLGEAAEPGVEQEHSIQSSVHLFRSDGPYGDLRLAGDGSTVTLKLRNLPFELALAIAQMITDPTTHNDEEARQR